jgi:nitrogen fixation protein NifU and related proteins
MAQGPYNETVMDHFQNPRNMGEIEEPSAVAEVGHPGAGAV